MRVLAVIVLMALPLATAHGAVEAQELEVQVLDDEPNELNDPRGGWDITTVFVGEAHVRELGVGPAGDGVYWRLELFHAPGGPSPLAAGEWRADLTFEGPAGPVKRSIRATNPDDVTSDFDLLVVNATDEAVIVERALVLLAPNGLSAGDTLTNFHIESYVGNELRDVAPGGIPVTGPVSTPDDGGPSGEYALTGPVRYANASVERVDDMPAIKVSSLLKKGEQHVRVHPPPGVTSPDPLQMSLKPGTSAIVRLDLGEVRDGVFDVTTDVGGRVTMVLETEEGRTTLGAVGGAAQAVADDGPASRVPLGGGVMIAGLLAAAVLARRR